jgi:hypothetical protein
VTVGESEMTTYAYQEMLSHIQQLSLDDKLQLLEDLVAMVRYGEKEQNLHNIMEFKGIAKEAWEGVDMAKYIDEERNSWDR